MTLEPCEVGFHPLPAATHGGQQRASGTEQNRPRLAPIIDRVFGYGHLDLHALYLNLLAPHLAPHFNDATRSLRAAVWRAGSVAARWESRKDPLTVSLIDLEAVCARPRRHASFATAVPVPFTKPRGVVQSWCGALGSSTTSRARCGPARSVWSFVAQVGRERAGRRRLSPNRRRLRWPTAA